VSRRPPIPHEVPTRSGSSRQTARGCRVHPAAVLISAPRPVRRTAGWPAANIQATTGLGAGIIGRDRPDFFRRKREHAGSGARLEHAAGTEDSRIRADLARKRLVRRDRPLDRDLESRQVDRYRLCGLCSVKERPSILQANCKRRGIGGRRASVRGAPPAVSGRQREHPHRHQAASISHSPTFSRLILLPPTLSASLDRL
jgi:hypothetical protein